jgi:hypothetical protein
MIVKEVPQKKNYISLNTKEDVYIEKEIKNWSNHRIPRRHSTTKS